MSCELCMELDQLRFDTRGLLPVVVQEVGTNRVLMLAYANRKAVELTLNSGWAHFYSRSRQELWKKGATSGNLQQVQEVQVDCDADTLLYRVQAKGPACHTGHKSCFYRTMALPGGDRNGKPVQDTPDSGSCGEPERILTQLFRVVEQRKRELPEGSYVADLLKGKQNALLRKIGEEATEVMLAAVEPAQPGLVAETADLWFHSLLVLARYDYTLDDLLAELRGRRG